MSFKDEFRLAELEKRAATAEARVDELEALLRKLMGEFSEAVARSELRTPMPEVPRPKILNDLELPDDSASRSD